MSIETQGSALQSELDAALRSVEALKEQIDELEDTRSRLLDLADEELHRRNEVAAESKRLRDALESIAFATGDQPAAMNMPEEDWYRRRFYDCVATAARALNPVDARHSYPSGNRGYIRGEKGQS